MGTTLPMLPRIPKGFCYRLDLSQSVTPRLLRKRPIHRWFAFPHSYSPELVEAILQEWGLRPGAAVLDPFVGAGTSLLAAQEQGYPAVGTDLSPLAVLVSRVKTRPYDAEQIRAALQELKRRWEKVAGQKGMLWRPPQSQRLTRAFTPAERATLFGLREAIADLQDEGLRDFFLVALLSIVPEFSRAVADGGWFRWVERSDQAEAIAPRLWQRVEEWVSDLAPSQRRRLPPVQVHLWDARALDQLKVQTREPGTQVGPFQALITSPPYPNRHDYTRIFQIELLLLGLGEEKILELRHRSLHSHVEARACPTDHSGRTPRNANDGNYRPPELLTWHLARLPEGTDPRVRRMLEGYFHDLFLVLRSAREVLAPGARLALVVGNVRHGGVLFPVDEILREVGEQADYRFLEAWVVRLRGNSAQQMGRFGRVPSRETVVHFQVG